jgi:hypothetical protein
LATNNEPIFLGEEKCDAVSVFAEHCQSVYEKIGH